MTRVTTEAPATGPGAGTAVVLRGVRLGSGGPVRDVRLQDGVVVEIDESVDHRTGDEVWHHQGAVLLPGFVDGHVHATQWALQRARIDVQSARSPQQVADLLLAGVRDRDVPPRRDEVLVGHGYRDALWAQPPHQDVLENALPGQPVAVVSQDMHAVWLSPAALALLGRDHPTGVLREQDALDVVQALDTGRTAEQVDGWVAEATAAAAARGLTEVIDFEFADNRRHWTRRTDRDGDLAVRVRSAVWLPWLDEAVERGLRTGEPLPGARGPVEVGPFKLIADGSLNTRTAYCHAAYPDSPADGDGRHGMLLIEPDELTALMSRGWHAGLLPAVHAIGDRANTVVLDAFEQVGCAGRIEHAQHVRPDDADRFARPGLVASVQPQHAMADRDVADHHWEGRTSWAFPYRSLLTAGARLELGSDAPVSEPMPWQAVADAVRRTDDERPPWHVEQAIPLSAALPAASGGRTGVRVGDRADLVLAGADPATVPATDLAHVPVLATLLAGRFTHRADG